MKHENLSPPKQAISADEIESGEVGRRSFLRGFGIIAGTAALTGGTSGCAELFAVSDPCRTADPIRSDSDPYDPYGAASDSDTTHCDSD